MKTLLCIGISTLFAGTLAAQVEEGDGGVTTEGTIIEKDTGIDDGTGANQAAGQAASQANQNEAVRELTPAERIQKLEKELDKLKKELDYLRAMDAKGGLPTRVKSILQVRKQQAQTINAPDMQPTQKRSAARLLGDTEKTKFGKDVLFTVDGQPVTKPEFDGAVAYLKSLPHEKNDDELKKRAVLELVKLKIAAAAFAETSSAALKKINNVQRRLAEGTTFAVVAKEMSDCPSGSSGGDLGYFGRIGMDFFFTRSAFSLKEGQVSKIIPTTFGYHIIKVTGIQKGADSSHDQVKASHILALYHPDQTKVREAQMKITSGGVDLAFMDEGYRGYTPDILK